MFKVSIHHRPSKADQVRSICRNQYIPMVCDNYLQVNDQYKQYLSLSFHLVLGYTTISSYL